MRSLDPKVLPDSRGVSEFLAGMIRDCERYPGKFLTAFCFYFLDTKKVFQDSSLLSNEIFSVAAFPHVMRGGEGK